MERFEAEGKTMTNPIIIFASSPDGKGAWNNFERWAIALDGKVLDPNSMDAAVIVLEDKTPPDKLPLEFDQEWPVFVVEHAGTPPNDGQRAVMANWPTYRCVATFNHVPGTYFYEKLKILLGPSSEDAMRQAAVADIVNRCSADSEWLALSEFAMVQQIKLLDPQADTTDYEAAIKALASGADMFDALNDGVDAMAIINGEIGRLSLAATD